MNFYKRYWAETTGEESTNDWGTSTYYFETDNELNVVRQMQVFEKGHILKYNEDFLEDQFGMLSDQPLDEIEFEEFKISQEEFNILWYKLERKIS